MQEQKKSSRASEVSTEDWSVSPGNVETFVGYDQTESDENHSYSKSG
jgi:alanyl-tRNA synthetase